MAFLFLVLGIFSAYSYVNVLPKIYRASVIFTLNPAAYQQGILREVDDSVIGGYTARKSEALTRRPEVRFAFYASSLKFSERVAHKLFNSSPKVKEFFGSERSFLDFVKQYLDYYRFQLDQLHIIHWHNRYKTGLAEELRMIVSELDMAMRDQLVSDLTVQKEKLEQLYKSTVNPEFRRIIGMQDTIVRSRLSLVSADDFRLIDYTSDIEMPTGAVYPQRIFVMTAFVLFWLIVGMTGLSSHLLRKRKKQLLRESNESSTI